jgi:hypothetical protein
MKIEDCQKFAAAGRVAITPAQVIKAAETLILQTGKYTTAYHEWIGLAATDRTYQNFKTRMTAEYSLQNQIHTTSHEAGYHHANAALTQDDEQHHIANAASDFAAATAADQNVFAQLTATNGDLNSDLNVSKDLSHADVYVTILSMEDLSLIRSSKAQEFPVIGTGEFSVENATDSTRLTNKVGPFGHIRETQAGLVVFCVSTNRHHDLQLVCSLVPPCSAMVLNLTLGSPGL